MNQKYLLTYLILFFCSSVFSQVVWIEEPNFEDLKEQARAAKKNILIIGCTEWCAPCKTLKDQQFRDTTISRYVNENFIVADYDMEAGIGLAVAKKYSILEYPTLIILNSQGTFVKRIAGAFIDTKDLYNALSGIDFKIDNQISGISTSWDLEFPEFYATYFENKTKGKMGGQIVEDYLKGQKNLFSEVNWRIMSISDLSNRYNDFIYNNYEKFRNLYGDEAYVKINQIVNIKLALAILANEEKTFVEIKRFMSMNDFSEQIILEKELLFYGKTGLNWATYSDLLNKVMQKYDVTIRLFCKVVYEKCLPKELIHEILFWLDRELKTNPSSWAYLYKGLFFEKNSQKNEAATMYLKTVEAAPEDSKSIYKGHIQNMRLKLCKNKVD